MCGLQICPIWDIGFLCECTPVFIPVAMRANLGSYREWCGVEVYGDLQPFKEPLESVILSAQEPP